MLFRSPSTKEEEPEAEPEPIASDEELADLIDSMDDDEELSEDYLDEFWDTGLLGDSKSAEIAAAIESAENAEEDGVRDERWEEVKGMLGKKSGPDGNFLSFEDAQDKGLLSDQDSI